MRLLALFSLLPYILSIFIEPQCSPVYIALRQQNVSVLPEILRRISDPESTNYGKWLTHSEIHDIVDATHSDQQHIMDWARSRRRHIVLFTSNNFS